MNRPSPPSKETTRQLLEERETRLAKIAERFDQLDEMLDQVEAHIESEDFQPPLKGQTGQDTPSQMP